RGACPGETIRPPLRWCLMAVSQSRSWRRRPGSRHGFGVALETEPMESRLQNELPGGPGAPPDEGPWQYEPKWDGFRCLTFKSGETVELRAKSGKPLGRYFPEVVALLRDLDAPRFVVDGELVIEIDGQPSFDALQMRLHPAESRIRKLSAETPARLILFDILVAPDGTRLVDEPLWQRRKALEDFAASAEVPGRLVLSTYTRDRRRALTWLAQSGAGGTDGVVAKRLEGPYEPGVRAMIKVKRLRTA